MTTNSHKGTGGAAAPPASIRSSPSITSWIFRLIALAIIDAFALATVYLLLSDGIWTLASVLIVVTIAVNVIFLVDRYYPLRWISPGLALTVIFVLYPILFTVYISFTNYGDGHLLTKQQVIEQYESQVYLPADATTYNYTAYTNNAGEYLLWLASEDGSHSFTVTPGDDPIEREGEPSDSLDGYNKLQQNQLFSRLTDLAALKFGNEEFTFQVSQTAFGKAAQYEQLYVYDADLDALVNQQTGEVYFAVYEGVKAGTFTSRTGETLVPGFVTTIGAKNYTRLFTDPALREPFIIVFIWTIMFSFLSVLLTFSLGTFLAILFDVPEMPGRHVLRSLLLIPYAIPAFVTVPVWVGLLNPRFGVVSQMIYSLTGFVPPWFADPTWAKIGILLIQVWLGTPYMFVIVTGALQALPRDIYEAADLDGVKAWAQFRWITLPLLLITVGPLLVASFAYNFNNFTVIQLYNNGGPPMENTLSPVGYTDILATYTYRIAFASGRGADQGYAAAITVIIFLILVVITALQFRYTNMLEEASENV